MTDTFRKAYRQLSEFEQELVEQIKDEAVRFEILLDSIPKGGGITPGKARYIALARTALEETVMWATKAVTT
jgi:hypothetical protein